jgi:hypothetical protein
VGQHSGLHAYGTDSGERQAVPVLLAVASVVLALGMYRLLVVLGWSVPWWLDMPSVMGMYGILHTAFDRHIWKWSILRRLGLVIVPDLSGKWKVRINSSHSAADIDADISIHQSWKGMHVRLETEQSRSTSQIAMVLTSDPNEYILLYEYLNSPKQGAVATMHMHRGNVEVRFPRVASIVSGNGEYYSGRDRANQGTLTFTRG